VSIEGVAVMYLVVFVFVVVLRMEKNLILLTCLLN
jgi:hypothetical protein